MSTYKNDRAAIQIKHISELSQTEQKALEDTASGDYETSRFPLYFFCPCCGDLIIDDSEHVLTIILKDEESKTVCTPLCVGCSQLIVRAKTALYEGEQLNEMRDEFAARFGFKLVNP
jgi:hypothetical protein